MSIVEKAMRRRRRGAGDGGAGDGAGDGPERSVGTTAGDADDGRPAPAPVDAATEDGASSVERAMTRYRGSPGAPANPAIPLVADEAAAGMPAGDTAAVEPVALHAPAAPRVPAATSTATGVAAADSAPDVGVEVPTIAAGDANRPLPALPAAGRPADGGGAAGAGPAPADTPSRAPTQTVRLDLSLEALRESGLLPAERQTRRIEDQYRRIKRPLLARAFGINMPRVDKGNLVMVASSLPSEGKSFTSFNLALSIAQELDRTVLLVDADVAKPHLTRALQLQEQRGLIDLLLDPQLDLQDVILRTSTEGLRFLPSGPVHRHSTELLASTRMAQLVTELSARYPDRVIIFDTPPLIPTTEAQAMAHLVGQIVVVVHAGHTPQSAVLQSLETLGDTAEISFVLNKTRTAWGEEYGNYGRYDGYGYGYGSD